MKALVTGAAGFIGSTLTDLLLTDPANYVIGLDSFTDYYSPALKEANLPREGESFRLIRGDLNEVELDDALGSIDVVFHQAGQPGVRKSWGVEFGEYLSQNVSATQRLLEAARRHPNIQRIVYASSSSVYGNAERFPTAETDRPIPRSPYGVTKLAAEQLCSLYAGNFGLPTVSLRYFTVYGPRQRPDMAFNIFIRRILRGQPLPVFGNGSQVREFTFVSDIAKANILAATRDVAPGSVINLSGGSAVSLREVFTTLEAIHGSPLELEHLPAVPGDVSRTGGSTEVARRLLGWEPRVALGEGLTREYEWLKGLTDGDKPPQRSYA